MSNTIFDLLSLFQASDSKGNKDAARSVMHRFLAEYLGGQAPKGNKATYDEVAAFTDLMKTLPSSKLIGSMEILEEEFKERNTAKANIKNYRYSYKVFVNWCESNGHLREREDKNKITVSTKRLFRRTADLDQELQNNRPTKILKEAYALMATHGRNGKNRGQLIYPSDYINAELENQFSLYPNFRRECHGCGKATIENELSTIKRHLGWLHRFKSIPLEDLRLTSIILFTKLNVLIEDYEDEQGKLNKEKFDEYYRDKAIAREKGIDLANRNMNLIKEYLDFVANQPRTRLRIVIICIAIAKFVFKNEIGTDEYIDDSDLPIIKRLNKLSTELSKAVKNTPDIVPHEDKSVPWNKALYVLDLLKKKADCSHHIYESKYCQKQKRKETAIVNDLQGFLSLAFMLLIPTDRARTYYELELGRTFVHGLLKDGRFIPVNKLKNEEEAIWYIHLMPNDYKTGKTYKEYWGIMPNVIFGDGKKLYEYIDDWITKGRQDRQATNHNYFFRGVQSYKHLSKSGWCERIKRIFESATGVPVTPKEIRKMFVTHIHNQGATHAELKGASYAMHHSDRMQGGIYNCQTAFDKVAPITQLNDRVWKETFGKDHFGSFDDEDSDE